jgi:hypothetical protein
MEAATRVTVHGSSRGKRQDPQPAAPATKSNDLVPDIPEAFPLHFIQRAISSSAMTQPSTITSVPEQPGFINFRHARYVPDPEQKILYDCQAKKVGIVFLILLWLEKRITQEEP